MKLICSHKDQCDNKDCPHARPHEDCNHVCERVAVARCVVDAESLPVYRDQGTIAISIQRLRRAA